MLSSRDQRRLEPKFSGLVLVLGLVVVFLVLVLMHRGLVVSKVDYAKYLLLLAMVTLIITLDSSVKVTALIVN